MDLIPDSGRSPGEGNSNPLRYSRLENPMDRGAWRTTAHGVAKSRTRLGQPRMRAQSRLQDPPHPGGPNLLPREA